MGRKITKVIIVFTLSFLMSGLSSIQAFAATVATPKISGQTTFDSATVMYSSPGKISGYEVSYATKTNSNYQVVYTGTKTTTLLKSLSPGVQVTIKVRSYVSAGSAKTYSNYATLQLVPALSAVNLKGFSAKGINTLTWAKVIGATSYEVYTASSYSGEYKMLAKVNTLSYKANVGLKTGLYYKVRAFTAVKGVMVAGPFSQILYLKS